LQVKRFRDTYLIRLERGEEIIGGLQRFADAYRIGFGAIRATGTLQRVILGYYDVGTTTTQHRELDEPVELLSLSGSITQDPDGERTVHAHATVGRSDCTTLGGRVIQATVGPTVEVVVETAPITVRRRHDPDTRLDLWNLEAFEALSA
jgi:hypothetical protein